MRSTPMAVGRVCSRQGACWQRCLHHERLNLLLLRRLDEPKGGHAFLRTSDKSMDESQELRSLIFTRGHNSFHTV